MHRRSLRACLPVAAPARVLSGPTVSSLSRHVEVAYSSTDGDGGASRGGYAGKLLGCISSEYHDTKWLDLTLLAHERGALLAFSC